MILHTPDILNTEAGIVRSSALGVTCKIVKLSGQGGEPDLWMYNTQHRLSRAPGEQQVMERLGLQVYVSRKGHNVLLFNTWYPHIKIVAQDSVTFYFHGGESWRGVFLVPGLLDNKRKRNIILIQNHELCLFADQYVNYLEILNHRTGKVFQYSFLDYPNEQYKNAADGERLWRIVTRRILGAKDMLARSSIGQTNTL